MIQLRNPKLTDDEAIALWVREVHKRPKAIDPDDARDWEDLAYGFFLGLGVGTRRAVELRRRALRENLL